MPQFTSDPEIERAHALTDPELTRLLLHGIGSDHARSRWGLMVNHRLRLRENAVMMSHSTCNPHIYWSEIRPGELNIGPHAIYEACRAAEADAAVRYWDCGMFVTWNYRWAQCHDPMGFNFAGEGDTDILLGRPELHPHYTDNHKAMTGAIGVYFGGDLPGHAIIHVDTNYAPNPLVGSMGSDAGPLVIPKNWEDSAHPGQDFVWLSVGTLL